MKSLVKVALRFILLLAFLDVLRGLPWFAITTLQYSVTFWVAVSQVLSFLISVAIMVLLWRKVDWFARLVAGDVDENGPVIPVSRTDLLSAALKVLGAYLFATAVPRLIGIPAYHLQYVHSLPPGVEAPVGLAAGEVRDLLVDCITLILGALLVLGGKRFAGVFRTARDWIEDAPDYSGSQTWSRPARAPATGGEVPHYRRKRSAVG